jgi:hypothetical protein
LKRALAVLAFAAAIACAARPVAAQQSPVAAGPAQGSLAQRLATGAGYVIVTRRDLFPRPSEGAEPWFVITGYYVPENGTWTSNASGFSRPSFFHACPRETLCGGIHEAGRVLERWYRPEQHEIVAMGERLTFDEEGRLFHEGRQIGFIHVPRGMFAPQPL